MSLRQHVTKPVGSCKPPNRLIVTRDHVAIEVSAFMLPAGNTSDIIRSIETDVGSIGLPEPYRATPSTDARDVGRRSRRPYQVGGAVTRNASRRDSRSHRPRR